MIKIPKIQHDEILFFLPYTSFLFVSILSCSFYYVYFSSLYKYIGIVCVTLLFLREIPNRFRKREFWGAIILTLLSTYIVTFGQDSLQISFACTFLFAFCARNIDFRKISAFSIYISVTALAIVVFSAFVGIIPDYIRVTSTRVRHYLGFRYALYAPSIMTNVILLMVYYKKEHIQISRILVLLGVSYYLFVLTDSRLTFALSCLALVVSLVNKIRKDSFAHLKTVPKLLVPSFILCCIISIISTIAYNPSNGLMREINEFLGKRLQYGQLSMSMYGFGWFGNKNIEWVGWGLDQFGNMSNRQYLYVDNMYLQLLQKRGFLFLLVFIIMATAVMVVLSKKKENLLLMLFSIIALHGVIDDLVLYFQYNTFWLLFGAALFGYINRQSGVSSLEAVKGKRRRVRFRF